MFSVVASTTARDNPQNRPEPEILDEGSLERVVRRWRGHEHVSVHATKKQQIDHFNREFRSLESYRDEKLSMKELQTEVIRTHEDIDSESLYNMQLFSHCIP